MNFQFELKVAKLRMDDRVLDLKENVVLLDLYWISARLGVIKGVALFLKKVLKTT